MNPHIELVKKSLADDTSVTEEELEANIYDSYGAWAATDYKCDVEYASFRCARAAYWADYWAAAEVVDMDADSAAKRWKELAIKAIKEYEELTK